MCLEVYLSVALHIFVVVPYLAIISLCPMLPREIAIWNDLKEFPWELKEKGFSEKVLNAKSTL